MYKKGAVLLMLMNLIMICAALNVKGITLARLASTQAFQVQFISQEQVVKKTNFLGLLTGQTSGQRILTVNVMEKKSVIELEGEDYNNLLKIVEAEAGGEDRTGKLLVANVIINRVKNEKFPKTVTNVIYQKENGVSQFSPVSDGRMERVRISEDTIEAVDSALAGEDNSKGALYFVSRKGADPEKMKWFDLHLTKLFTHGGHEFFA